MKVLKHLKKKENPHLKVNNMSLNNSTIGVIGAGTMGSGIAQIASQNGHPVILVDSNENTLKKSNDNLKRY